MLYSNSLMRVGRTFFSLFCIPMTVVQHCEGEVTDRRSLGQGSSSSSCDPISLPAQPRSPSVSRGQSPLRSPHTPDIDTEIYSASSHVHTKMINNVSSTRLKTLMHVSSYVCLVCVCNFSLHLN